MHRQRAGPLTVELALHIAGWDSRYAHVLWWHGGDGLAIGVFDTNGDGVEVEVEVDLFEQSPGRHWTELASGFGTGSTASAVWTCAATRRHSARLLSAISDPPSRSL
jgi:hypothetical protein